MNTKTKSTLYFIISVLVIGILAFAGAKGITIGEYQFSPFSKTISRGLDLTGGTSIVVEIQQDKVDKATMEKVKELLSLRVNSMGVSETTVSEEGSNHKKIRIDIPKRQDADAIVASVTKAGKLTFVGPDKQVILEGKDVSKATVGYDQMSKPVINLELNTDGAKKFADATSKFLGQKIAINMDETELTAPTVQSVINDGKAQISGSMTMDEATRQAKIINSGALPVEIKTVEQKVVGPTLGANAMPQSVKAGAIGIGIVFLFMLLYYRLPGLIADIALVLYIVLVLGVFSAIKATLTLSGIAGFLLTVGMAVDANILIFERMKEELKSGKSIKSAIDAGFHRAMSSIMDSNITTIIAGFVLYFFGSGTVKGFALTLIIGVVLSMLTAITVTRFFIKQAANMGWFNKKGSIGTFGVHDVRRG